MADYTPNYFLVKPDGGEEGDFYNVEDFNQNADILDAELSRLDEEKASLVDGVVPAEQLPNMDYDPLGTAGEEVDNHNASGEGHQDIRDTLASMSQNAETAYTEILTALSEVRQLAETAASDAETAAASAAAALAIITDLTHTIEVVPSQSGSPIYTGSVQSPAWANYDPVAMTLGGATVGTDAGGYTATFTPKNGYKWDDDTTTAKNVTWSIGRASIAVTPSQSGSLTYTGNAQSPVWNNYNSAQLTVGSATSGTDAGSYIAAFTPKANYAWADGTITAKNVAWSIARATGSSAISPASFSLTSSELSKTFTVTRSGDGVISAVSGNTAVATVSVSGNVVTVTGQTSGSATITVSVAQGTNHTAPANKTCSVTVSLAVPISAIPSQSGSLTYTGGAQSPNWVNYNSAQLTIGGTASATNAGTYTATFRPKSGYMWSDGSTAAKSVTWAIGRIAETVSISPTSLSFVTPYGSSGYGAPKTVTAVREGNGSLIVASYNTSVATVSSSGNTVTVTPTGLGSTTIAIQTAGNPNYLSQFINCPVSVSRTTSGALT